MYTAYEDEGVAMVPIIRGPGDYGKVSVEYEVKDISAELGVDYRISLKPVVNFNSGQSKATVDVTILDDSEREYEEQFLLILKNPSGK